MVDEQANVLPHRLFLPKDLLGEMKPSQGEGRHAKHSEEDC